MKGFLPKKPVKTIAGGKANKINRFEFDNKFSYFEEEEKYSIRNFWKAYARRKTLIDFSADFGPYTGYPRYGYDWGDGVYWYKSKKGKRVIVPLKSIKLDIERFANNICTLQRKFMSDLINGIITPQEWYDDTLRVMKISYGAMTSVAIGSKLDLSVIERQKWLDMVREEVEILNSFATKIESGSIPIDGRLLVGACSFGRKINQMFENWKLWQAKMQGRTMARRILGRAEHCHTSSARPGCVELAKLGWVPIDKFVPIGDATCYSNCKCRVQFK